MADNEESGSEVEEDEVDVEEKGGDEDKKEKTEDIRNPDVVTKYKQAADAANAAIDMLVKECKAGRTVVELCEKGDKFIEEKVANLYKKGAVIKGIGFPTCISVNNVVGCFSPLKDDKSVLAEGDVVKIDLGVHVDGYLAMAAHTLVIPSTEKKEEVKESTANLMAALNTAADCVLRLMKPGTKNTEITGILNRIAKAYGVSMVEGVRSHDLKRFEIDGEKVIANDIPEVPLTGDNKIKEVELAPHEVYAIDIVMSTGKGQPSQVADRTTVYKKNAESNYQLKMKASRSVLSEIQKKFPTFPFTIRSLTEVDEKKVKFGIVECAKHGLVEAYPVLHEKEGVVGHLKFTVLLLPSGTLKVTGRNVDMAGLQPSIKEIKDEKVLEVLAMRVPKKKSKKKGKKKAAKPAAAAAPAAAAPAKK